MIKAILIDCFGVLFENAYEKFLHTHTESLKKFLQDLKPAADLPATRNFPQFYEELTQKSDRKEISDERFYYILSQASHLNDKEIKNKMDQTEGMLNQPLYDFIKKIKKEPRLFLSLISNADFDFLSIFLPYKDIGQTFDAVFSAADLGLIKSNPQFWQKIIETIRTKYLPNILPHEILVIDDSASDLKIAKSLNLTTLLSTIDQFKQQLEQMIRY